MDEENDYENDYELESWFSFKWLIITSCILIVLAFIGYYMYNWWATASSEVIEDLKNYKIEVEKTNDYENENENENENDDDEQYENDEDEDEEESVKEENIIERLERRIPLPTHQE